MNNLPSYYCGECKMAVIVIKGEKPIKACNCNAPIIANMEAVVVRNTGGVKG